MKSYRSWLNEIVRTDIVLPLQNTPGDSGQAVSTYTQPKSSGRRDKPGFPILDKPGFRTSDLTQIQRESPQVEKWLDKATAKFGVHWLVLYMPPEPDTQTIDDPETSAQAVSVSAAKRLGKPGWDKYHAFSHQTAEQQLYDFVAEFAKQGVNVNNIIVYVKPTSRVHTLKAWQQAHNIGHAVWGYAKQKNGKRIYADFNRALRQIVYDLQMKAYEKVGDKQSKPNAREIIVMLGRVLGVGASFRRIFTAGVDDETGQTDFDKPSFRVNTAMNSYDEAMYDLIAAYLNAGGRIPIKTTGDIQGTPIADRAGEVEPNKAIQQKFQPRDFVWKALASDQAAWEQAVKPLEDIIGKAFVACTWGNNGGPIYATSGYVTTSA